MIVTAHVYVADWSTTSCVTFMLHTTMCDWFLISKSGATGRYNLNSKSQEKLPLVQDSRISNPNPHISFAEAQCGSCGIPLGHPVASPGLNGGPVF